MKKIILLTLLGLVCCNNNTASTETGKDYSAIHGQALDFCKSWNFNPDYYFLVDMSIHSGKNRFFIYDFNAHKIIAESLVTHGSCDVLTDNPQKWEKAAFNNADNSHCSALGKYKIGKRDTSRWGIGIKYWLHGLEKTNSNAEKRVVVLHSWEAVPDKETFPEPSPLSWGCPAVSDAFMEKLDKRLQKSGKPVLLWIVD